MKIAEGIATVLAFRRIPTTILVVLVYAAVFSTVLVTDELPKVPNYRRGLDLEQAYADLHEIAARPHAYNSHANDIVRSYILSRLQNVTAGYPFVHISDDLVSNGSWTSGDYGVYFEGTNILVKVDGSDPEYADKGGALFSAHYDSVSTAPGATDDGMGVATLMQMVGYFTKNRPRRTAIFNINNGEEDWLNGAHAFLQHPWASIPDTFLNLEGAASGGRPILFRATSTAPLLSFLNTHVPHPHSNVLSADAFARGLIRSGTDYSVYTEGGGMEGLDLAFYKGRSKYHTRYDSIPHTVGQERSLWSMMEAAMGAGLALVNDDKTHGGKGGPAVYFDLFGAALVVFPLSALLTFNIILLIMGPVILILLLAFPHIIEANTRQETQNGNVQRSVESTWREGWQWFKEFGWVKGMWRWAKFWLAVIVAGGLQTLLVLGYVKLNPFIVYSEPYLVVISSLALAYLSFDLTLNIPIFADESILPEQHKHSVLLQTYVLTWLFLLVSTIIIGKAGVGGLYFITAWNIVVFLGCALGCAEEIVGAKGTIDRSAEEGHRFVRGVRYDAVRGRNGEREDASSENGGEVETEPTEITPLVRRRSVSERRKEEGGTIGWWILQLLIVVPVPVILITHIGVLLVAALSQTLADGSSATVVYSAISLLAVLIVLPLAPFSFKFHRRLTYLLLLIFAVSTAYNWLAFPFSQEAPLKVYFQQKVALDFGNKSSLSPSNQIAGSKVLTALRGVPGFLDHMIIPKLPSATGKDLFCLGDMGTLDLETCAWKSELVPAPGGTKSKTAAATTASAIRSADWLVVDTIRTGNTSARISIKGTNTRSCRIYFDSTPITRYVVKGSTGAMQPGYEIQDEGLSEVRLWSRTWDRRFVVDVEWDGKGSGKDSRLDGLKGRVACEWVEYESGSVGISTGGKIPAFEEVLDLLPIWAVVSKATDGLVEAWGEFSI